MTMASGERERREKRFLHLHTRTCTHAQKMELREREGSVKDLSSILSSCMHGSERARTRERDGEVRRKYLSLRDGICFCRKRARVAQGKKKWKERRERNTERERERERKKGGEQSQERRISLFFRLRAHVCT